MSSFEELKKKFMEAAGKPDFSWGEVLLEAGVTPQNMETLAKLLEEAGFEPEQLRDPQAITSLINNMSAGMSPEMKSQFKDLVEKVASEMGLGPIPPGIAAFLADFTK